MTLTRQQIARLPKAKLITIRRVRPPRWPVDYRTRSPFFIRWRNANARGFMFGNLIVTIRAPWLEGSARVLHPEVFSQEGLGDRPERGTKILIATGIIIFILAWLNFPWEAFAQPFPAVTR